MLKGDDDDGGSGDGGGWCIVYMLRASVPQWKQQ